jgi:hypothetical protein
VYSSYPGLVLGFHGCDETVGRAIVAGDANLKPSKNTYDWLGHGVYFWEFNPARALSFAKERAKGKKGTTQVDRPFVVGAVIDLGHCLNLLDENGISVIKNGFKGMTAAFAEADKAIPKNVPTDEPLRRDLDCAVIESVHALNRRDDDTRRFDTVRGVFVEGDPTYPGAGVYAKSHIQICVRNPNCIKGFFIPRKLNRGFPRPHEG